MVKNQQARWVAFRKAFLSEKETNSQFAIGHKWSMFCVTLWAGTSMVLSVVAALLPIEGGEPLHVLLRVSMALFWILVFGFVPFGAYVGLLRQMLPMLFLLTGLRLFGLVSNGFVVTIADLPVALMTILLAALVFHPDIKYFSARSMELYKEGAR